MKTNLTAEEYFSQQIDQYCNSTKMNSSFSCNDIAKEKTESTNIGIPTDGTTEEHLQEAIELLQFSRSIATQDFSTDSNRQMIWEKTDQSLRIYNDPSNTKTQRGDFMKTNTRYKMHTLLPATAAILAVCFLFAQTSFAQNIIDNVIRTFTTGRIEISQMGPEHPLPDYLVGKLFDENGNKIEIFNSTIEEQQLYTADGTPIDSLNEYMKSLIPEAELENLKLADDVTEDNILIVSDINTLNDYTCFPVILPDYLPAGYVFDRADFYKDDLGKVENSEYISLYFKNIITGDPNDYIVFHQRAANEHTAYSIATDYEIASIKINNRDAVLTVDRNIDWETDEVFYSISGRGHLTSEELVQIAESVQTESIQP